MIKKFLIITLGLGINLSYANTAKVVDCEKLSQRKLPVSQEELSEKILNCGDAKDPANCKEEVVLWASQKFEKEMEELQYCINEARKKQREADLKRQETINSLDKSSAFE